MKLDLIAPHLVHLTWPGPWFGPKKAEMKVATFFIFHEVDDADNWPSLPRVMNAPKIQPRAHRAGTEITIP